MWFCIQPQKLVAWSSKMLGMLMDDTRLQFVFVSLFILCQWFSYQICSLVKSWFQCISYQDDFSNPDWERTKQTEVCPKLAAWPVIRACRIWRPRLSPACSTGFGVMFLPCVFSGYFEGFRSHAASEQREISNFEFFCETQLLFSSQPCKSALQPQRSEKQGLFLACMEADGAFLHLKKAFCECVQAKAVSGLSATHGHCKPSDIYGPEVIIGQFVCKWTWDLQGLF